MTLSNDQIERYARHLILDQVDEEGQDKISNAKVLVVGAGISGIMAAKTAAQNGLKTLLLDEKTEIGGSTIYQNREFNKIENQSSSDWIKKEIQELRNIKNLEIKTRTSVAAFHGYNYLLARESLTDHLPIEQRKNKTRQKMLKIRAKKVITDFNNQLEKVDKLSKETLEPIVSELIKSNDTNFKGVGQPLRVALTGSKFGPGLYDIVISLGKEEVKKRLKSKILA